VAKVEGGWVSKVGALLLVLCLAACGSSPKTQFYTLDAVPGAQQTQALHSHGPVMVGHVDLPSTLDRLWMVRSGPGNAIDVSDVDRWAAPLNELMRNALTEDLRSRLPPGMVLAPGETPPERVRTITLHVLHFMADQSGHVLLDTDWSIQRGTRPGVPEHARIEVAGLGSSGGAVAAAMSQVIAQLADRIATAI
jgi:uncharacterized protein